MNDKRTLEDVRAKLAELEAKRAKRREKTPEELLAEAEQALSDAEALDAAEAEHGREGEKIAACHTTEGVVILKRPNQLLWNKFADAGKTDQAAMFALVKSALVHPSLARFEAILEEQPAVLVQAADRVAFLAGVRSKDLAGK